jgi:ribosome-associated translation inhibitor RaiA
LIKIDGKEFYGSADKEDLYEAVDSVKDSLYNEINKNKDRRQTLFKRGAASVKRMIKGISKRNPFTSKY